MGSEKTHSFDKLRILYLLTIALPNQIDVAFLLHWIFNFMTLNLLNKEIQNTVCREIFVPVLFSTIDLISRWNYDLANATVSYYFSLKTTLYGRIQDGQKRLQVKGENYGAKITLYTVNWSSMINDWTNWKYSGTELLLNTVSIGIA